MNENIRHDKLDKILQELEIRRLNDGVLKDTDLILAVLVNADRPLTLTEIAQQVRRELTPELSAFIERLVIYGYLESHHTDVGKAYVMKTRKPGRMPEPLIPMPYHIGLLKQDRSN
jgi:hypothetical protein